ncbi:hypothetical protein Dimus_008885 [Dionaea muscipula]
MATTPPPPALSFLAVVLLFFFFFFFSLAIITGTAESSSAAATKGAADFIWASCRGTRYPTLCFHSLSGYADQIQHSNRQLAVSALAVSLSRARSASLFVSKLSSSVKGNQLKHREFEAVKDCIEMLGDSVDELSRSVRELKQITGRGNGANNSNSNSNSSFNFKWHMNNVETWVSAALTDQQTCVDGFGGHVMDGNVKSAVKLRVVDVAQVTSNALALVNRFAASTARV